MCLTSLVGPKLALWVPAALAAVVKVLDPGLGRAEHAEKVADLVHPAAAAASGGVLTPSSQHSLVKVFLDDRHDGVPKLQSLMGEKIIKSWETATN